jgi:hypothetical protein
MILSDCFGETHPREGRAQGQDARFFPAPTISRTRAPQFGAFTRRFTDGGRGRASCFASGRIVRTGQESAAQISAHALRVRCDRVRVDRLCGL